MTTSSTVTEEASPPSFFSLLPSRRLPLLAGEHVSLGVEVVRREGQPGALRESGVSPFSTMLVFQLLREAARGEGS